MSLIRILLIIVLCVIIYYLYKQMSTKSENMAPLNHATIKNTMNKYGSCIDKSLERTNCMVGNCPLSSNVTDKQYCMISCAQESDAKQRDKCIVACMDMMKTC